MIAMQGAKNRSSGRIVIGMTSGRFWGRSNTRSWSSEGGGELIVRPWDALFGGKSGDGGIVLVAEDTIQSRCSNRGRGRKGIMVVFFKLDDLWLFLDFISRVRLPGNWSGISEGHCVVEVEGSLGLGLEIWK